VGQIISDQNRGENSLTEVAPGGSGTDRATGPTFAEWEPSQMRQSTGWAPLVPLGWDDGRWNADEEQACDHNAETVEEDLTTTEAWHD